MTTPALSTARCGAPRRNGSWKSRSLQGNGRGKSHYDAAPTANTTRPVAVLLDFPLIVSLLLPLSLAHPATAMECLPMADDVNVEVDFRNAPAVCAGQPANCMTKEKVRYLRVLAGRRAAMAAEVVALATQDADVVAGLSRLADQVEAGSVVANLPLWRVVEALACCVNDDRDDLEDLLDTIRAATAPEAAERGPA